MKHNFKQHFESISSFILKELQNDEKASISYRAEQSYFLRFNQAKVRQNGSVEQIHAGVTLWKNTKTISFGLGLSGELSQDFILIAKELEKARITASLLPDDPYQSIPTANEKSNTVYAGKLLPTATIEKTLLDPVRDLDFAGLFSQGIICRGSMNWAGAHHWFETENFLLDYSVWLPNGRAVKSVYSGREWSDDEYKKKIAQAREGLSVLSCEPKKIEPGRYRMFITADALVEVVDFFSWNGFGERCMQQGESAYLALKEKRESFADSFSLTQDFSLGLEPAFNEDGELAPEQLPIVQNGTLVNTLVSSRSEKQYGVKSNGAPSGEWMRSVVIGAGDLCEEDALKELGTGIYVSNFHYLNWSDPAFARVTGMTRFACLWVEDGKVVAPIADMRWDESLYNMFGANLLAITKERHMFTNTATYEERAVGGCLLPGILVKDFNCTL
ncbi:hypothetical protein DWQ65_11845 [Treponema phagedenis]|uniref:Metalloprotease TldD/E C-terminal domain-containing protein n=1 Tax=Treponema phagedenis TaxID=162 RepID=A0A0B7GWA9_TREPH|nr:metallopeptidase TldD-related protein [Treponema phagedenis]NVP23630.1 hypothetical protein [Treponema phagedenis]QEJ94541.1 hypothetical protein FUT79_04540 [Treponema phagedenis]QEJ98762.1 hypothetical protein FUT82_12650 [Treponema phagedenis]QEK01580.1 hypothetical protein FUT84_10705 [Treponema phagedenis]QEK04267.1 hypothetical protein FUT83_10940 [Treponema phagedenis]